MLLNCADKGSDTVSSCQKLPKAYLLTVNGFQFGLVETCSDMWYLRLDCNFLVLLLGSVPIIYYCYCFTDCIHICLRVLHSLFKLTHKNLLYQCLCQQIYYSISSVIGVGSCMPFICGRRHALNGKTSLNESFFTVSKRFEPASVYLCVESNGPKSQLKFECFRFLTLKRCVEMQWII